MGNLIANGVECGLVGQREATGIDDVIELRVGALLFCAVLGVILDVGETRGALLAKDELLKLRDVYFPDVVDRRLKQLHNLRFAHP